MPSLSVLVDGSCVATMASMPEGVMSVNVGGTRTEPELAYLDVHGSSHPDGLSSTYLIWVSSLALAKGSTVEVSLLPESHISHPGRTIDELFPGEAETEVPQEQSWAAEIEDLRARPLLHPPVSFELSTSAGTKFTGPAPESAHGFGFSVLWNWQKPERASVSLHTYTIDSLADRSPVVDIVREYMQLGGSARLKLVA